MFICVSERACCLEFLVKFYNALFQVILFKCSPVAGWAQQQQAKHQVEEEDEEAQY